MSEEASVNEKWALEFQTSRVQKGWKDLFEKARENMEVCQNYLETQPLKRVPGRVFPLKGKTYRGAWEYEVTGGDRIYYKPNLQTRTVVVYYAGKHPKPPSPLPPS